MSDAMPARRHGTTPPAARLCLVAPALDDPTAAATALGAALAAADVAAVLLHLPAADERTLINRIKQVAPLVQARGAALLLDGRPDLVARAGADGAHLAGIDAVKAAVGALKPDRIVGAGGLASRHDAMLAAIEKTHAERIFEIGDPAGHRGLGRCQAFGRLAHAAPINDGHEHPQLMQLEPPFDAVGRVHCHPQYPVRYEPIRE